jgi:hypothetical protein
MWMRCLTILTVDSAGGVSRGVDRRGQDLNLPRLEFAVIRHIALADLLSTIGAYRLVVVPLKRVPARACAAKDALPVSIER